MTNCQSDKLSVTLMSETKIFKISQSAYVTIFGLPVKLTFDLLSSTSNSSPSFSTAPNVSIWWNSHELFVRYCAHKHLAYDHACMYARTTGKQNGSSVLHHSLQTQETNCSEPVPDSPRKPVIMSSLLITLFTSSSPSTTKPICLLKVLSDIKLVRT